MTVRSRSFFLSLGVHFTVIALAAGGYYTVKKTLPPPNETRVKILLEQVDAHPEQPPLRVPEPPKPVPPKPLPVPAVVPKETKLVPAPVQRVAAPTAVATPAPVQKTVSEAPSTPTPKAPPPTPAKEEYKYPHKKTVDSILLNNIKCTKDMNRLKLRGTVILSFDLTQNGETINIKIDESSGSERLDHAVEQQIKSIAPMFPKPDETVPFRKNEFEFKGCGN